MKLKRFLFVFLLLLLCCGCRTTEQPTDEKTSITPPVTPTVEPTKEPTFQTPEINLDGVVFEGKTVEYDGTKHSLEVSNVPEGITVTYENNECVDAGNYSVKANLIKDNEVLKSLTALLVITKRKASVVVDNQQSSVNNVNELTYTTSGVLEGDDLGVSLSVDSSSSGKKEIKGTWNNPNYDVTFNTATYTFTESLFNSSSLTASSEFLPNYAPFSLYDTSYFSDTVVTSISFPFHSFVSGYDKYSSNLFIPIYVVKNDFSTKQSECSVENGKLVILDLTNKLLDVNKGDWVTCDGLNIVVGKDETLAFGDSTMTVLPGFLRNNATFGFWNRIFANKGGNNHSLIFNIEGYKTGVQTESGFVEDDINYISFLGDSISTYSGISNSTSYNPTIGSNAVWYPNNNYSGANIAPSETWWYQTANDLGYEICVNNSWSGSVVNTAQTYNVRAKNLHNNLMHAPDIIVVFIGVNDYAANTVVGSYDGTTTCPSTPANFSEAYGKMLITIKNTYPKAKVFACTFLADRKRMSSDVNGAGISILDYLNAIKTISGNLGVNVIDLYNDSGINGSNISSYTVDKLHPNSVGMDLITYTVVDAINDCLNNGE